MPEGLKRGVIAPSGLLERTPPTLTSPRPIAFVWENLGPMHEDRLAAVEAAFPGQATAIQFWPSSAVYHWRASQHAVPTQTLMAAARPGMGLRGAWYVVKACRKVGAREIYLCHYEHASILLAAVVLRVLGRQVYCMVDSKFDDYPRFLLRELGKSILLLPYSGALVASRRSAEYMRFLGFRRRRIAEGYDALSVERIRQQTHAPLAPEGVPHADREFLIVARLVAKKNIELALHAFARFRAESGSMRKLRILGSGEREQSLRAMAQDLGVADAIVFEGVVQTERVSAALSHALCLILPSHEEQFGLVVIEAMAMGVPALVSSNAGAVDLMIDNGVNGWIIDPGSPNALIAAMLRLDRSAGEWAAMARAARDDSKRGDAAIFAQGVATLSGAALDGLPAVS